MQSRQYFLLIAIIYLAYEQDKLILLLLKRTNKRKPHKKVIN